MTEKIAASESKIVVGQPRCYTSSLNGQEVAAVGLDGLDARQIELLFGAVLANVAKLFHDEIGKNPAVTYRQYRQDYNELEYSSRSDRKTVEAIFKKCVMSEVADMVKNPGKYFAKLENSDSAKLWTELNSLWVELDNLAKTLRSVGISATVDSNMALGLTCTKRQATAIMELLAELNDREDARFNIQPAMRSNEIIHLTISFLEGIGGTANLPAPVYPNDRTREINSLVQTVRHFAEGIAESDHSKYLKLIREALHQTKDS